MNQRLALLPLVSLLAFLARAASGQSTRTIKGGGARAGVIVWEQLGRPTVTGAPYSAEEITECTRTLAAGTCIIDESQGIRFVAIRQAAPARKNRPTEGRSRGLQTTLKLPCW